MDNEFYEITRDIFNHSEFKKLRYYKHHGITRFDHCIRVAQYAYKLSKKLNLDVVEVTRAALLHDFFTNEVDKLPAFERYATHPKYAVKNAKKYFNISKRQEDMILTHMFPIGFKIPRNFEGWLIDLIDDYSAIVERMYSFKLQLSTVNV